MTDMKVKYKVKNKPGKPTQLKPSEEVSSCSCGHCSIDIAEELKIDEVKRETFAKPLLNNELIRMGIGAIIFITGLIFRAQSWSTILYILAYLILGYKVILMAFRNILKGEIFDENFLMTVASFGAVLIGEYPEAAGVMLFYGVGEHMQDMAVDNSRKSIKSLLNIKPDYANMELDGQINRVKPETVGIGDIIIVKPGEKIPLDGEIIEGSTSINTSALTGESLPREVNAGNLVLAGSVNINGLIRIKVTKSFGESTASRILKLVEEASGNKAKTESFITKFAKYYTPGVVLTALIIAVVPSLFINGFVTKEWIYRGLVFLVVSCPCALVLSIPLAYFGGIGAASKKGILVKGGNHLEALVDADVIIFDKTGTLTKGEFSVAEINVQNGITKEELLFYAAYGEYYSNHPIADSIKRKFGKDIDIDLIASHEEMSGFGIKANVKGKEIFIGNAKLMENSGMVLDRKLENGTTVHVAIDNEYKGFITVEDTIKESSYNIASKLKKQGIREVIMLTGDNETVSSEISLKLGMDKYYSELLPDDKLNILKSYLNKKSKVVAVGDGINDAPLLAGADIGFAMGALGSDAAVEAADIVLMTDEPSKILDSIIIAKKTRQIVWQNIIFALGVKGLVMILSTFGLAAMYQAVFADVGVAIIAVINSTRIMKG